jgi:hypothetical protein
MKRILTLLFAACALSTGAASAATPSNHLCASNGVCGTLTMQLSGDPVPTEPLAQRLPISVFAQITFDKLPDAASDAQKQAMTKAAAELLGQPLILHIDSYTKPTGVKLGLAAALSCTSCDGSDYSYSAERQNAVILPRTDEAAPDSTQIPRYALPVAPGDHNVWLTLGAAQSPSLRIRQGFPPAQLHATRLSATRVRLTITTPYLAGRSGSAVWLSAAYQRPSGSFGKPGYVDGSYRYILRSHGSASVSVIVPLKRGRWHLGLLWRDTPHMVRQTLTNLSV